MARSSYQVWTADMVIGAAIVIIGLVATLVRLGVIVLQWSVAAPPLVSHLWPLLLIGVGVLLLFEREERKASNRSLARSGERQ
ncbi:LiaF transmembrane domain-containing protein [Candidatus Korobacter versatilis]|uniref:LiaF transmembrane domain-containing protein n=1 Tax=Candidatus Korobacter versatilis TaxID=658062 RepID=UPI0005A44326|nr:hypothetical protein [Candidatus Koribacter versatilis]